MIKTEGMQSQLQSQLAIQQAMHNMNYFANPALYANQARLNSEGNLNALGGVGGIQPSSNHNLNSTSFLEGSGASYKQYLKNNKGSNHQLNDSNNSPGSVPHSHHNINISHFKNKRIIVKHANIVKKKRQIKIWTSEEDELLKRLCEQMPGKWNEIAAKIPGRNASQCSQRWRRILPTKVRKPWTPEEDQKVLELSEKYGKNWGMIAQHIEGKTGKQVRERYINKLDPSIKRSPWTEEEDQKILDMFLEQGPKWSAISNELVGRPENTVKNRFYSHISRIYLSDDNSYIANKNSDNNQKVKDACSNNTKNNASKKKQIQVQKVAAKNLNVMEEDDVDGENDEDDDDDDDDEDDDDEEEDDERSHNNNHLQNSQNMHNGNGKLGLNAPASMYSHINQAVANASQQFAMQNETNKKQQTTSYINIYKSCLILKSIQQLHKNLIYSL
ncbi:Myb-like DNA-binding domain protein (macronuclear) [Tetrahymena thermophila SB210]|uniref:Myb-like DNA-binding domain protein n=1 Tax=Tetrahymena thermophila (strain SB210) TaxID=312017 RepID=Q22RZ8_TETTS|nr:Myb-like DNA-binding domain protein [Tetrahymena thermophila SB210]EAR87974.2 Myb-like DNA-binding domain protein [Tetrahymena thermophila SB210]|eukprot:XP_001008219.2 Myb-like DNA-binding domain protein [Tetrahymena thermophila SB210]